MPVALVTFGNVGLCGLKTSAFSWEGWDKPPIWAPVPCLTQENSHFLLTKELWKLNSKPLQTLFCLCYSHVHCHFSSLREKPNVICSSLLCITFIASVLLSFRAWTQPSNFLSVWQAVTVVLVTSIVALSSFAEGTERDASMCGCSCACTWHARKSLGYAKIQVLGYVCERWSKKRTEKHSKLIAVKKKWGCV